MKKYLIIITLTFLIIPRITFASWWNPISWFDKLNFFKKETQTKILEKKIDELEAKLNKSEADSTITKTTKNEELIQKNKKVTSPITPVVTDSITKTKTPSVEITNDVGENISIQKSENQSEINWNYWDNVLEDLEDVDTSWYKLETEVKKKPEKYEKDRSTFTFFSPYVEGTVAEGIANRGYEDFTNLIKATEKRLELLEKLTDSFKDFKNSVKERNPNIKEKYDNILNNTKEVESNYDEYSKVFDNAFDTYDEFAEALEDLGLISEN